MRCGNAAGSNGPVVFVGVGMQENMNRLFTSRRLTNVYNLPEGSRMLLNKSGYMDDETWVQVVESMAPGIRQMPVIRDHPNWEALLSYDGFKSHINVEEGLKNLMSIVYESQKKKLAHHTSINHTTSIKHERINKWHVSC